MELIKRYWTQILVVGLLGIMFGLMFFSAKGDSNIVDEIAHIPAGYSYITTGDYRLNPEHPPLIKDLAGVLPFIAGVNFPYDMWRANMPIVNNQWEMGWQFIYRSGNDPEMLNMLARIPVMLISLLLGYFVYRWAKELYGKKAGIMALVLYVFNANVIAHSRYVTTDLGISAAFFINMYFLYKYLKAPNYKNMFWAALTFGIVLLTKFSAAVLVPTYLIVFVMLLIKKNKGKKEKLIEQVDDSRFGKKFLSGIWGFGLIAVIGFLLMWVAYIPHVMNMPAQVQKDLITESLPNGGILTDTLMSMSNNVVTRALGQWFLGFFMVASHVEGGHDAFLLGQTSNQGWWYYYPVVIFLKTQIALFALMGLTVAFWKKLKHKEWFTEAYLWVLPVVLLYMGMQGKINLGIRYMLPIYPFIFVFVAKYADLFDLKQFMGKMKRDNFIRWQTVVIGILMTWYVAAGVLIYPHYLAYYNEFVGGYKNGYKYLTDSNTDWGQDVKRLSEWVDENNIDYIYVDVFPGTMPAQYYLGDKMIEWHVQNGRPQGYFAVSATFYQNSRLKKDQNGGMDYSWLDDIKPVYNLGGSILIYDLR